MSSHRASAQSGFALILSLLALVLLTTMGLALSGNAGTELQIASNHRFREAARYNAEAGIEYGKSILKGANWGTILPPARLPGPVPDWDPKNAWNPVAQGAPTGAPPGPNPATRNFENWKCDTRGYGMGYGVVIMNPGTGLPEQYHQNIPGVGGVTLNGAFTLWVRRPVRWNAGLGTGTLMEDYPNTDVLILVSEGVAPFPGAAPGNSVYTIETLITGAGGAGGTGWDYQCSNRSGQVGGSAQGGNSASCGVIQNISEALTGATGKGTLNLK